MFGVFLSNLHEFEWPIIRASGTLSVLALFDLIFSNLDNQNITLLKFQWKHHLVDMPVERHFVRYNEKTTLFKMLVEVAVLEMPIERPYTNRKTFCRCQSKDLL